MSLKRLMLMPFLPLAKLAHPLLRRGDADPHGDLAAKPPLVPNARRPPG